MASSDKIASSDNHIVGSHSSATMSTVSEPASKQECNRESLARLLWINQCYEAMPSSSKIVIFDMGLHMDKAFNGLLYQGTRHVLLSDPEKQGSLDGILSVTDFINVVLKMHKEKKANDIDADPGKDNVLTADGGTVDIGSLTIKEYRDILGQEGRLRKLVYVDANASLFEAACLLIENKIHRLPVIDDEAQTALYFLTHKRILNFLWIFGQNLSVIEYAKKSAKELNVGTYVGIRVVFPDTPLEDCLEILLNKGVSGVPVIERATYKVLDIYSRFDAIGIAADSRLDITVEQALEMKNKYKKDSEKVVSVNLRESLWKCVHVLVEHSVHRLCVVNDNDGIEGIISLSDVISFLVVQPGAHLRNAKPPKRIWHRIHTGDLNDQELRDILITNAASFEAEFTASASQPAMHMHSTPGTPKKF